MSMQTTKMPNIEPKKSEDPLAHRGEEPWIDWATKILAHTRYELTLTPTEWEKAYQMPFLPTYRQSLEAQERRLSGEVKRYYDNLDGETVEKHLSERAWRVFTHALFFGTLQNPPTCAWGAVTFVRAHRTGLRSVEGGFVRLTPTEPEYAAFEGRIRGTKTNTIYIVNREVILRGYKKIKSGKTALLDDVVGEVCAWFERTDEAPILAYLADHVIQVGLFGEVIF